MNEAKRKALTVIGCICFAVPLVLNIYNLIQYRTLGGMLGLIVYLLLMLALAFRSPLLLIAGGIVIMVQSTAGLITNYAVFRRMANWVVLLQGILNVVGALFVFLLGFSKHKSVHFGCIDGAIALITALLVYFGWHIPALNGFPQEITLFRIVLSVAAIVGWIVTGCLRREMPSVNEAWGRLVNNRA